MSDKEKEIKETKIEEKTIEETTKIEDDPKTKPKTKSKTKTKPKTKPKTKTKIKVEKVVEKEVIIKKSPIEIFKSQLRGDYKIYYYNTLVATNKDIIKFSNNRVIIRGRFYHINQLTFKK